MGIQLAARRATPAGGSSKARVKGLAALAVGGLITSMLAIAPSAASAAAPAKVTAPKALTYSTVTLSVVTAIDSSPSSAHQVAAGDPITDYKWVINEDNVGDPLQSADNCHPKLPGEAGYAASRASFPTLCNWPSIKSYQGYSPIVAAGDNTELNLATALAGLPAGTAANPKKYLISVTAPDYKIDGTHFTLPMEPPAAGEASVVVKMNPTALPTTTVRIRVFNDNRSLNSQWDGISESFVPAQGNRPAQNNMSGFEGHISDILGVVTNDVYNNPLCTTYQVSAGAIVLDADGVPVVDQIGGKCASDRFGNIVIPNLGPNRYATTVIPPDEGPNAGEWIQTTTLEGSHDWDSWNIEGQTGFDTERIVGNEATPFIDYGFVRRQNILAAGTGSITGYIAQAKVYVPQVGGQINNGSIFGGGAGTKIAGPITDAWVGLSDINDSDLTKVVQKADKNGHFTISNVPDGTYTLTYWDETQDYILDLVQVTVLNHQTLDVGTLPLSAWYTQIEGHIFIDTNGNGRRDPGETGVPDFGIVVKQRQNSVQDQGSAKTKTTVDGSYQLKQLYPLTAWLIIEAYNDRYRSTGVTYQADNQPNPTTVLGDFVDVNILPVIGLGGTLDWGVQPYDYQTNGGIVGTVTYDALRNETEAPKSVQEDSSAGIPGLTLNLYKALVDPAHPGQCVRELDGSCKKGDYITSTITEGWNAAPPTGCVARDVDGNPIATQQALAQEPFTPNTDRFCIEAPQSGVQFGADAKLDGNYAFKTYDDGVTLLPPGDYLVEVVIPDAPVQTGSQPKMYKITSEADINVYSADAFYPQGSGTPDSGIPGGTPAPAQNTSPYYINPSPLAPGLAPECGGVNHTVTVDPTLSYTADSFLGLGGSIFEGKTVPYCDVKHVRIANGKSVAPNFYLFTDVPQPTRFSGVLVDDLNLSVDPKTTLFGEKQGIPQAPIGIYDYTGRLDSTVISDPNGMYEVLLPSTDSFGCPTPTGICATVYRLVGNDPGRLGAWNDTYNPQYRTIATNFQGYPGLVQPVDQAPTQIGVSIQAPGSQINNVAQCREGDTTPQLFAVDLPYNYLNEAAPHTIRITGQGFGTPAGKVSLGSGEFALTVNAWTANQINVTLPANTPLGPQSLNVKTAAGVSAVNTITYHVMSSAGGSAYNKVVYTVDSNFAGDSNALRQFTTIQAAIDRSNTVNQNNKLIVVKPGKPSVGLAFNPLTGNFADFNHNGTYFENPIISRPVQIQGVGPGGTYTDAGGVKHEVLGSVVSGANFWASAGNEGITAGAGAGVTEAPADAWRTIIAGFNNISGPNAIPEGQVFTVLATTNNAYSAGGFDSARIDGLAITGGDQQGFPTNLNTIGGAPAAGPGANTGVVEAQGGAIYVNAYAKNLNISNNVIQSNGGTMGAIRIGTPEIAGQDHFSNNTDLQVNHNRILANGGTMFAGAIGLFNGADRYNISYNDFCGNFSAEYGGAISHYGLSTDGVIHHNRIYFNQSYDEGGGIMIAGELPKVARTSSPGAGSVTIYDNLIQANLSNDDGGGIRFLQAGNFPMDVHNNIIASNIATHEGAGVALDDTPRLSFYNNTVVHNTTTATAITSDGNPAPTGLSTGKNSAELMAQPSMAGFPTFSKPTMFNNIFADNRAGSWTVNGVQGIGLPGDATPIRLWDMGTTDVSGTLDPTNTILNPGALSVGGVPNGSMGTGYINPVGSGNKFVANTAAINFVADTYPVSVSVAQWRNFVRFRPATIVAVDLPITQMGNYHLLNASSPANAMGAATKVQAWPVAVGTLPVSAGNADIDHDPRLTFGIEAGADELPGNVTAPFTPPFVNFPRVTASSSIATGGNNSFTTGNGCFTSGPIPFLCPTAKYVLDAAGNLTTVTNGWALYNGLTGGGSGNFTSGQVAAVRFSQMAGARLTSTARVGVLLATTQPGVPALTSMPTAGVSVAYQPSASTVTVSKLSGGGLVAVPGGSFTGVAFANGEGLMARINAAGKVEVFKVSTGGVVTSIGEVTINGYSAPASSKTGLYFAGVTAAQISASLNGFYGGIQ